MPFLCQERDWGKGVESNQFSLQSQYIAIRQDSNSSILQLETSLRAPKDCLPSVRNVAKEVPKTFSLVFTISATRILGYAEPEGMVLCRPVQWAAVIRYSVCVWRNPLCMISVHGVIRLEFYSTYCGRRAVRTHVV